MICGKFMENLCRGNNAYGNKNYHELPMNLIKNWLLTILGGKTIHDPICG